MEDKSGEADAVVPESSVVMSPLPVVTNTCGNENNQDADELVGRVQSASEVIYLEQANILEADDSAQSYSSASEYEETDEIHLSHSTREELDMQRACAASLGIADYKMERETSSQADLWLLPEQRTYSVYKMYKGSYPPEEFNDDVPSLDHDSHRGLVTESTSLMTNNRPTFAGVCSCRDALCPYRRCDAYEEDHGLSARKEERSPGVTRGQQCSTQTANTDGYSLGSRLASSLGHRTAAKQRTTVTPCSSREYSEEILVERKPSPIIMSIDQHIGLDGRTPPSEVHLSEARLDLRNSFQKLKTEHFINQDLNTKTQHHSHYSKFYNLNTKPSITTRCPYEDTDNTETHCERCDQMKRSMGELYKKLDAMNQDRNGILIHLSQREVEWEIAAAKASQEILALKHQLVQGLRNEAEKIDKISKRHLTESLLRARSDDERRMAAVVELQNKINELRLTLVSQQTYVIDLEHDVGRLKEFVVGLTNNGDETMSSTASIVLENLKRPDTHACKLSDVLDADRSDFSSGSSTNPILASCDAMRFPVGEMIGIYGCPPFPPFNPMHLPYVKEQVKLVAGDAKGDQDQTREDIVRSNVAPDIQPVEVAKYQEPEHYGVVKPPGNVAKDDEHKDQREVMPPGGVTEQEGP